MLLEHLGPQTEIGRHRLPALVAGICASIASIGIAEEPISPRAQLPEAAAVEPISVLDQLTLPRVPLQIEPAVQHDPVKPQEAVAPSESAPLPAAELPEQITRQELDQNSVSQPILSPPPVVDASAEVAPAKVKETKEAKAESPGTAAETSPDKWNVWQYAQNGALWVTLVGIPFLWLTWRKRADEALERWKVNDEIKNGRLESDIRLNIHRFEEKNGVWSMQIINSGRITVKELFGEQHIYADVLGKAASLSDKNQPFPIFNFKEALATFNQMARAWVRRTSLPTESLMAYNCRVRTRDLLSAEFNPERRSLDPEKSFDQRKVFGILVREKMPQASTLVLCVLPETSLARFGDDAWVSELKANSDAHDVARIDQLKLAYERERDFLNGHAAKSVFPWANVLFPASSKKENRSDSQRMSTRVEDLTPENLETERADAAEGDNR